MRTRTRIRLWNEVALFLGACAVAAGGYAVWRLARPPVPPVAQATTPSALPQAASPDLTPAGQGASKQDGFMSRVPAAGDAPGSAVPKSSPPANSARPAPKRTAEIAPAPVVLPAERFAAAPEPPAPAPASVPESVPVPPAPPPDRWQMMADAISQCGREGFFAGVMCEQRVRLQYCEGHWGQAAQCPSGIPNDHGR